MTTTAEALSAQAAQLPPAERMQVVERILDSLDQPDAALDTLWAMKQVTGWPPTGAARSRRWPCPM